MRPMRTILVVDDSLSTRRIIRKELSRHDFEVIEAQSGKEAIGSIFLESPDLITLDLDMPEMNGYQTLSQLRETWERYRSGQPFPPVIIVTGRDSLEERERGFAHGAANFLVKPFRPGALATMIRQVFNPNQKYLEMNVLVVDDSSVVRKIIVDTLTEAGIRSTWEATDGDEAFHILANLKHKIDLVITDYAMPRMNGDEFCRKAREELQLKTVPFIFLSQLPERSYVLNLFEAGATDYLVKPFVKEELIARVITHFETRLLNKTLEQKVDELTKLNQIKDDFVNMTSHDLRSPLSGIIGLTELMLLEDGLSAEMKENMGMVRDAGQFLIELVNDILDLSAIQTKDQKLPLTEINVLDIASTSLRTFKQQAHAKKISLGFDCSGAQAANVMGDANALTRVINNLVSNAVKFTRENGKVTLTVDEVKDHTVVSVTDTGIGIPKKDIPELFNQFNRVSRLGTANEKGTGLGLCISKELVEKQNGTFNIESQPGKGTRIELAFPTVTGKSALKVG